jgi:plasmid replication initiation protein
MKESYNKNGQLRCITCGDTEFEYNDDKSWIKCIRCGREYKGGKDELIELNQENFNDSLENSKDEIVKDLKDDVSNMFKKAFKGNKFIKFK